MFPSDYVGASLTTFLHGIPLLYEEGKSLLRSYVLRNTPAWLTHDQFLAEYLLLSDRATIESHFHTSHPELQSDRGGVSWDASRPRGHRHGIRI